MPLKDLKKRKLYTDKYNRERRVLSKEKRREYYLTSKLKMFRRIFNEVKER